MNETWFERLDADVTDAEFVNALRRWMAAEKDGWQIEIWYEVDDDERLPTGEFAAIGWR